MGDMNNTQLNQPIHPSSLFCLFWLLLLCCRFRTSRTLVEPGGGGFCPRPHPNPTSEFCPPHRPPFNKQIFPLSSPAVLFNHSCLLYITLFLSNPPHPLSPCLTLRRPSPTPPPLLLRRRPKSPRRPPPPRVRVRRLRLRLLSTLPSRLLILPRTLLRRPLTASSPCSAVARRRRRRRSRRRVPMSPLALPRPRRPLRR